MSTVKNAILNPEQLLRWAVTGAIVIGLVHLILDQVAFDGGGADSLLKGFFNDLFAAIVAVGYVVLGLGFLEHVRRTDGGITSLMPFGLPPASQLIRFFPIVILVVGLLHLIFNSDAWWDAPQRWFWWQLFDNLFFTIAIPVVMVAAIAVLDALNQRDSVQAPADNADDPDAETKAEGTESSSAEKTGFWPVTNIQQSFEIVKYAIPVLAAIGLIELIFEGWIAEGDPWAFILSEFFWRLSVVLMFVGLLLIARLILNRLLDVQPKERGDLIDHLDRPESLGRFLLFAYSLVSGAAVLAILWDERNSPASDFWAEMTSRGLQMATGFVLLYAGLYAISYLTGDSRADLPGLIRKVGMALYTILYLGLIATALIVFVERESEGSEIWYWFFNTIGTTGRSVVVLLGIYAIALAVNNRGAETPAEA